MIAERRTLLVTEGRTSAATGFPPSFALDRSQVEGVVGICLLHDSDADAVSVGTMSSTLPLCTLVKPKERYLAWEPKRRIRAQETAAQINAVPALLKEVLRFAAKLRASDLWFVLEGQTLVRLAYLACSQATQKLHIEIPGNPSSWLRMRHIDHWSAADLLRKIDNVVSHAEGLAVGSLELAALYETRLGRRPNWLPPVLDTRLVLDPAHGPDEHSLRVGVVGAAFATPEFFSLVEAIVALRARGEWRSVGLHVFVETEAVPCQREGSAIRIRRCDTLETLIGDLAELDLLYCCDPFMITDPDLGDHSSDWLPIYFAAGRPILFHGRANTATGRFLRSVAGSFFCFREGAEALQNALLRSLRQRELYAETAQNARALLERHFSMEAYCSSAREFIGNAGEPQSTLTRRRA